MATLDSIREALLNKISNLGLTSGEFYANLLIAILLVIVGVFLGKIIKFFLRKGLEKIKIEKMIKWGFIELFLTVIKWSIYILFIDFALRGVFPRGSLLGRIGCQLPAKRYSFFRRFGK